VKSAQSDNASRIQTKCSREGLSRLRSGSAKLSFRWLDACGSRRKEALIAGARSRQLAL
jgi:hypothetical protein